MRGAILAIVGMALGALAALGYSHYFGEGKQLVDLQSQLAKSQSDLASAQETSKLAKKENDALADQVQQLITTKNQLQKQVSAGAHSTGITIPMPPGFNRTDMAGMVKAQMNQTNETKLRALEMRLHLTPEQVARIKAVMDAESERTAGMSAKLLAGQKIDYQSLMKDARNFQSTDQVLQEILTPEQKTAYQQMQSDERTSSAESMASMQMNQVAPLLNLSENQKDQVESALYQVQMNSEDPKWIQKNTSTPGDPTVLMDAEEKAKEDALAPILTPDQMAAYKQQTESQLNMQKSMMQKFMPPGGFSAAFSGTDAGVRPANGTAAPASTPSP